MMGRCRNHRFRVVKHFGVGWSISHDFVDRARCKGERSSWLGLKLFTIPLPLVAIAPLWQRHPTTMAAVRVFLDGRIIVSRAVES